MRFLVCGGRDFDDREKVFTALNSLMSKKGISAVIHGGANGADSLAGAWAAINRVEVEVHRADWGRHGKGAGPVRNKQMLDLGKPDGVVAFPGGRGTADMIRQAKAAGLKVWEPYK